MNKCYVYILPLLNNEINIKYYNLLYDIKCSKLGIYLYYKYDGELSKLNNKWIGFPIYINELYKNQSYDSIIAIDETNIMIEFNIPDGIKDDYNKIINGKYSELSNRTKKIILDYLIRTKKNSTLKYTKAVLYKEQWLYDYLTEKLDYKLNKNNELESIFNEMELIIC